MWKSGRTLGVVCGGEFSSRSNMILLMSEATALAWAARSYSIAVSIAAWAWTKSRMARRIAGTRPISRNARSSVWRIVTRLRKSLGNKVEASMICHAHLRVVLCCISAGLMSLAGGAVLAADASKNETSEASPPYELGSGVRLWNSGFYLGGYGSSGDTARRHAGTGVRLSHSDLFL